jgi:hypothetical protein
MIDPFGAPTEGAARRLADSEVRNCGRVGRARWSVDRRARVGESLQETG